MSQQLDKTLKLAEEMNLGQRSGLVWSEVSKQLAQLRSQCMDKLLCKFRAGDSMDKIYLAVAELAALDEIRLNFIRAIKKGERAGRELNDSDGSE